MLSRVADNLYWMSRYLERAEHIARLLDVNLHQMPDQTPQSAERRWGRLLAGLRSHHPPGEPADAYQITHLLTLDSSNPNSIVSCIARARFNARQAWEQISTEMWEQLNRLFLKVQGTRMDDIWLGEPHAFYRNTKNGIHLFQGLTDSTLSHGEGWQFIQAGRSIERARSTAALLDVHFSEAEDAPPLDYLEWVGLLKSCTAFEAHAKVYTAEIRPDTVAAFLLLNAEFPRSVRFVAGAIQAALQSLARTAGMRSAGRPERLAGRLRASLDYSQIDEILTEDMHAYLESIQQQCDEIHAAIYQTYIGYAVGAALAARRQAG